MYLVSQPVYHKRYIISTDLVQITQPEITESVEIGSSTSRGQETAGPIVSLLDRLKCPKRSELSRKRIVPTNKRHKPGSTNSTDPKGVSPSTRLKEFPDEYLAVRAGKLFCTACREELALKSTMKNHIACGDKHQIAGYMNSLDWTA